MTKRLRIFAGPNGSGKSSIINKILNTEVRQGVNLDFGIYINADDITQELRKKGCNISNYSIKFDSDEFIEIVEQSGLINDDFPIELFNSNIIFSKNKITIKKSSESFIYEKTAQIIADYLRKQLLKDGKKFSFETVFSHQGKVDFIKQAKKEGYKVYLYFVSTEDPEINIYRVKKVRVPSNGHDVPEDKIVSRYYRSMDLLFEAAQYCYQSYFFDNSSDGKEHSMFAHFKLSPDGEKVWDDLEQSKYPNWFIQYYSNKIKSKS